MLCEFKNSLQWSLKNNILSGITLPQWLSVLRKHWRDISWAHYWHRVLFLTVLSIVNWLLSLIESLLYRKAVENVAVHPEPVFILGHPRSGTTLLQNILSLDPRFGFVTTFQAGFPSHFLLTEKCAWLVGWMIDATRPMDAMEINFKTPAEDEIALNVASGGTSPYMCLCFMHQYSKLLQYLSFEECSTEYLERWLRALHWFMKKVSVATGGRPLLLKSPPHMGRLAILKRIYPRAKYIFIHRNPVQVIQSCAHMGRTCFPYCSLSQQGDKDTTEYIFQQHDDLYRVYFREKTSLPPSQLVEVSFSELDTDPVGTVERIYTSLGWKDAFDRDLISSYCHSLAGFQKNDHHALSEEMLQRVRTECGDVASRLGYKLP